MPFVIFKIDENHSEVSSLSQVQKLYNLPTSVSAQGSGGLVAIPALAQFPQAVDIIEYMKMNRPDVTPSSIRIDVVSTDGGDLVQSPTSAGGEGDLDVQMVLGISPSTSVRIYTSPGTAEDLLNMMNDILDADDVPDIISLSYAFNDPSSPAEVVGALCDAFMQLGTRGTSILVGSGDGGVSGGQLNNTCTKFQTTEPSGCPYVTSVGATTISNGVETAASMSSGGFSTSFEKPEYQTDAVNAYINQLGPLYEGLYSSNGRGYPDLAVIGTSFPAIVGGKEVNTVGTSVSAPAFAGMVALLNAQRRANQQSILGFLNPLLYAHPEAFNDMTQGSNPGCGTQGFPVKTGWDPVTGLGAPDFEKLLKII